MPHTRRARRRVAVELLQIKVMALHRERRRRRDDERTVSHRLVGERHPSRLELVAILLRPDVAKRLLRDAAAPHAQPSAPPSVAVALVRASAVPLHRLRRLADERRLKPQPEGRRAASDVQPPLTRRAAQLQRAVRVALAQRHVQRPAVLLAPPDAPQAHHLVAPHQR
eukprot:CAMPEP_0195597806 /NCGR_PEP_ID=MMETSP0815-20121206/3177_1 /TAXON_ID=97485 /ORGANISM="Prymnesium parvum, Strain Texoma1" /LENGTH=167 /DNA_ID=CAMNT_0040737163 /DNA_START=599 /DNA_END=1099 /DNA_ORIENTATION=-